MRLWRQGQRGKFTSDESTTTTAVTARLGDRVALGTFKVCADEDRRFSGAAIRTAWRFSLGRLFVGCFVGLHISATQVCREGWSDGLLVETTFNEVSE